MRVQALRSSARRCWWARKTGLRFLLSLIIRTSIIDNNVFEKRMGGELRCLPSTNQRLIAVLFEDCFLLLMSFL